LYYRRTKEVLEKIMMRPVQALRFLIYTAGRVENLQYDTARRPISISFEALW
jgi:hypothetical protein